jgi:hypothetical protein
MEVVPFPAFFAGGVSSNFNGRFPSAWFRGRLSPGWRPVRNDKVLKREWG